MKILQLTFQISLLLGVFNAATASTINLQFSNPQLDVNYFCTTIQVQSTNNDFILDKGTISFSYNVKVLQQPIVAPIHYNNTLTNANNSVNYTNYFAYNENATEGKATYNISLSQYNAENTIVSTTWVDVFEVCFEVVDIFESPALVFDETQTAFSIFNNGNTELYALSSYEAHGKSDLLHTNGVFDGFFDSVFSSTELQYGLQFDADIVAEGNGQRYQIQYASNKFRNMLVLVYDNQAQLVSRHSLPVQTGEHETYIDIPGLNQHNAQYAVQITDGKTTLTKPLIFN